MDDDRGMTRPFCLHCARKFGKQLWQGACACSGHVNLVFTMPGPRNFEVVDRKKAPPATAPAKKKK